MRLTAGLALAGLAGCTGVCKGPGCEDAYAEARLSIVSGFGPGETLLEDAFTGQWRGTEVEGSDWLAVYADEDILLGQPDAGQVLRLQSRNDVGRIKQPDAKFTGVGTEFGAQVVAIPESADRTAYDLWVSAPGWNFDRGAIHLFRSAQVGPGRTAEGAELTLVSGTPSDRLGDTMVRCKDLDGDGVQDIAVTAPFFAKPSDFPFETGVGIPQASGTVFFVLSTLLPASSTVNLNIWDVSQVYWGDTTGEGAGAAVLCGGETYNPGGDFAADLDGDNVTDLVIGAPWFNGTDGRVYRLTIDAESGALSDDRFEVIEGANREWFGTALTAFKLAGSPALAVGAPGHANGTGRVHVFPGSELATLRRTAVFTHTSDNADHFGRSLASGDVLGTELDGVVMPDGVEDLVVGAPDLLDGKNGYDTGRIWVWSGANSDVWTPEDEATSRDALLLGTHPFERLGRRLHVGNPDELGIDELLLPTRDEGR